MSATTRHSITSRYVHSADAVLLAAADAVANATMTLMASDQAQPQLRDQLIPCSPDGLEVRAVASELIARIAYPNST